MRILVYILIVCCVISACSPKLAPGETLYTGASVKIEDSDKGRKEKKSLSSELSGLVRPRPNSKFLGIRFKLMFSKLPFVGKRIGEPPVLTSSVNFEKNTQVLQNRLENRGYFHAKVTFDTTTRRKKTSATFIAKVGPQYTIDSISFPVDSSELGKAIARTAPRTLFKKGEPYDLDVIKQERARIDTRLKNRGFYYFSPDYLIVNVDSTIGGNKVNLMLRVKPETPLDARSVYRIKDIIVHADYSLNNTDTSSVKPDSSLYNGYFIIDPEKKFKPKVFDRTLVIKPGDIYSRADHNLSLNRLVSLGVYKFVKVQFEEVQTDTARLLNAYYYLTPLPKKSIRFEVGGLNKSNNATGSEITLSWRNRNLLRGAELLTLSAFAGIEKQISGQQPAVTTNRLGADINFIVPRITFPFKFNTSGEFVPQTRMNLGYELYNRTDQYSLNSFKLNVGYQWKEEITKEHQLNVFSINYVDPMHITSEFQEELKNNPTLQRTIEPQFIIGSNYNYNRNDLIRNRRTGPNSLYLNLNVDLSGNLLGLITGAKSTDRKTILSVPFAQYVRIEPEVRHYLRFNNSQTNMLATRMILGVGYAYGNSDAMPFSRAFFIGGTNSLRGFRARSVGPGTYYGGDADTARTFLPDEPGDIKLEMNAELRFNLTSIFNGALFIDAGNIWTLNEDPLRPGSKFSGKFLSELAVDAGFGIRLDLKLVILRGDVAFPLKKPWLKNNPDTFRDIKENYIFNLAIGYPF